MNKLNSFFLITSLLFSCSQEPVLNVAEEITQIEKNLQPGTVIKGEPLEGFSIQERMKYHKVPGASIAVVVDGKIRWAKGYGTANTSTGSKVDENTLFQAGSISKPLAALAALKLVDEGRLDLDEDVNTYLKEWTIPPSKFTEKEKVTLRRLLTHTAGMTVHGFPGYTQTEAFPSVVDVLEGKGNTPPILVDTLPGSIWRYSGGGYTVMEKIVEDVSGKALEEYIGSTILRPMGLSNSTYQQPLDKERQKNASAAYYSDGSIVEGFWNNYPERAAAGLWTTPSDLARYCIQIQEMAKGNSGVLSAQIIENMLTPHMNNWGLGPSLSGEGDDLLFQHGGKNAGFTNNLIAFARKGQAVIVMTNADNGGRLNEEIIRSVSNYYGWELRDQKVVNRFNIELEELEKISGKYLLSFEVRNIGDYYIDVTIQNGVLKVFDPNNDETNFLTPIADGEFVDLNTGDGIRYLPSEEDGKDTLSFNNRFNFIRVQ